MTYTPHRILVTGGAGFIGANFIQFILQQYDDISITNIDALTYAGSLDNLAFVRGHTNYCFIKEDICSKHAIEAIMRREHIDTIVHFAAESHVDRSIEDPALFLNTNVGGTHALLEAARKIWLEEKKWGGGQCRFHHISTDEVYGHLHATDPAFTEMTPYNPSSPYSASKASSDHFVRAYHRTYGLPITLSNCSNNYGPYQHREKLIPTIIHSCVTKQPIPIYGNGQNIRDWLHVRDHCAAIDIIVRKALVGESYNIGGNAERTNLDLTKLICTIVADLTQQEESELLKLIHFVADRPGHDFRYAINSIKMQHHFNWNPAYDLKSGLKDTIQWYLQHYY